MSPDVSRKRNNAQPSSALSPLSTLPIHPDRSILRKAGLILLLTKDNLTKDSHVTRLGETLEPSIDRVCCHNVAPNNDIELHGYGCAVPYN
jgi:hypothetical protein